MGGYADFIEVGFVTRYLLDLLKMASGSPLIYTLKQKSQLETVLTTLHASGKFGAKILAINIWRFTRIRSLCGQCSIYFYAGEITKMEDICSEFLKAKKVCVKKVGPTKAQVVNITIQAG
jgi:hypothetical protein